MAPRWPSLPAPIEVRPGQDRNAILGYVAGALMGEAISESMARQELELDQELAGSGAHITNTGSQPLVILPENAAFPTGSDNVDPGFRPPAERDIASSDRAP